MRTFNNSNSELKIKNMICINDGKYQMEENPFIKDDMTRLLLEDRGFKWPIINKEYFKIFE